MALKRNKLAWHFVGDQLRDGRPVPKTGTWLKHAGPLKMCNSGLHYSLHPWDALQYAPGNILCRVKVRTECTYERDKGVCRERKIIKKMDISSLLNEYARWCALQVIELWNAPDIVKRYLQTGNPSLQSAARSAAESAAWSAARSAAWSAARSAAESAAGSAAWSAAGSAAESAAESAARSAVWSAAGSAAWSAARSAARSAAESAQKEKFAKMVYAAFNEPYNSEDFLP